MQDVNNINFEGKIALIRVDFNVPLNDQGKVTDDSRIQRALPTIEKIRKDGGAVILMSHLGRPKKQLHSVAMGAEEKLSLRHVLPVLEEALQTEVAFAENCIGEEAFNLRDTLGAGDVLLLENLRFYEDEKKGERDFAEMLAQLGHIYVNDAFGTAHRAHASTSVVPQYFSAKDRCAGLLMAAEIQNAKAVLENGEAPFTAILGGAKVSDKIGIIRNLMKPADHILIGGAMAYTFIKAQGGTVSNSLVEEDKLDLALALLQEAKQNNVELLLPQDSIAADAFANHANTTIAESGAIPEGYMGLDIGPKAAQAYAKVIEQSKTILWNGPMGVFEMERFQAGTKAVGEAVAKATTAGAFSLVGGGDSVAAVHQFQLEHGISYISTGGGAMLEFFEGKTLPGIKALS